MPSTPIFFVITSYSIHYTKLYENLDANYKYVCFVGHLAPWQGVEYLIKSSPYILNKCPNTKFVIVGEGPKFDELVKLVNHLNISQNYLFTGYVNYETVPLYINASNICVAPFVIERNERIGLSALKLYEYLACGKPVVASKITGIEELLSASNGGISVAPVITSYSIHYTKLYETLLYL